MNFNKVDEFEKLISEYFNSSYGVAVDSCTHAIELCIRLNNSNNIKIPKKTYVGVAQLGLKLNLEWSFIDNKWKNFYFIEKTNIIDAAVLWKKNSYIKGTLMCLSFQYQKHLNIGRGGMILTDNKASYESLKKMSYDGRLRNRPWREQNINTVGYHYYMTPESASRGIELFRKKKNLKPKKWDYSEYPDLSKMKIFSHK